MKKLFTLFITGLFAAALLAQAPQKMSYQAVVRNSSGALVTGQGVGMKISILQGSATGSLIYQEIYNPNPETNENGLLSLDIGDGIPLTGTFSTIDWSDGPYYLMTETDPSGGTNYTISGTSQLLSVPYALHANSAKNYTETDPLFDISAAAGITGANISDWNAAWGWGDHASAGYVPNSRSLTINGTAMDLTVNRSWKVGTVTSVGLYLPDIFSLSGSPVTTTGTLTATLASQTANQVFAAPVKGPGLPVFRTLVSTDIPALSWSKITTGLPTTLEGYGITDAATKAYVDQLLQKIDQLETQTGIVKDVDGNLYTTVKIGTQIWMSENLKTTKYKDGAAISLVTDITTWSNLFTPAYCWYGNNEANKELYGALYNWYTASSYNICPAGWHVPTADEWTTLENYLIDNGLNYDGTTTGNKIGKALASNTLWAPSTVEGAVGNTDYPAKRNSTGFTALPGGERFSDGYFSNKSIIGYWWSSTLNPPGGKWGRRMSASNISFSATIQNAMDGLSIRCVRD